MEHFAQSRFWRGIAVALVVAIFYFGWAISGDRSIFPTAHAGGIATAAAPGGAVYTTDTTGSTLYTWHGGYVEKASFDLGTATRKALYRQEVPAGQLPPGQIPAVPGGSSNGKIGGDR